MTTTRIGKPQDLIPKREPATGSAEGSLMLRPGDPLFAQGDAGGDLYFIEEGTVEIYTQKDGQTVVLSEMGKGEIIGVMTCLTNEPRMASARAKTAVSCRKVPHASVTKVLAALPGWLKVVLKEFSLRLKQMNKAYSEAVVRIKKLEANQASHVQLGALLASAFASVAEFLAIKYEDSKIVVIEDLLQRLEFVLNMRKEDLDRIFAVLLEAGLLRPEIEPEKKRTVVKLEHAQRLAYFAQFVRESKHGATKKLVRARFTHKETRVLSAIVKFAARLEVELEKNCRLPLSNIEKSLERVTGVKFERAALEKAATLKLLSIEGQGADAALVMKPSHLGRTVACVEAVRKLSTLDQPGSDKVGEAA